MPEIKQISAGGTTYDVYDSAARAHMQDATVHVTAAEKSTWNAKQDALSFSESDTVGIDDTVTSGSDNLVTSSAVYDAVSEKYSKPNTGIPEGDLASDVQTSLGKADSALQSHQSLAAYRTAAEQDAIHDSTKQDVISDLAAIRSGAALGATAVQPETGKGLFSGSYNDLSNKPTIPTVPTNVSAFNNDSGYLTLETLPRYAGGVS